MFQNLAQIPVERYWKDTHSLIKAKLRSSLNNPCKHLLLVDPRDKPITKALVVEIIKEEKVQFVGPVYYHPSLTTQDVGGENGRLMEKAIIGDVKVMEEKSESEGNHNSQSSDLLLAAADGNEVKVEELLMDEFDPNFHDKEDKTAQHLAAQNGHEKVMELLLKKGADPNLQDKEKKTALYLAAQNGHKGVVELLLRERGRSQSSRQGG